MRKLDGWNPSHVLRRAVCLSVLGAFCATLPAQELHSVSREEAGIVVARWLATVVTASGHWAGTAAPAIRSLEPILDSDAECVGYVATVDPGGYVIVPAVRELPPIKAYSTTNAFTLVSENSAPQYERWVAASLAASLKALKQAASAPARGQTPGANNLQQWETFLAPQERSGFAGVQGIEFAKRQPLLRDMDRLDPRYQDADDPQTRAKYRGNVQWRQSSPLNQQLPRLRTTPEEVWVDRDRNGKAEVGATADAAAYDADGTWTTTSGASGIITGVYYFRNDDGGDPTQADADAPDTYRLYTTDQDDIDFDILTFPATPHYTDVFGGGYDVWKDEFGGTAGVYDEGIDTRVSDGGDLWSTLDQSVGAQTDLLYRDADSSGDYTGWQTRPLLGGTTVAMGGVMRYWEWPDAGRGSHSYDWQYFEDASHQLQTITLSADFGRTYTWRRMPLGSFLSATEEEKSEVASLLADVGMSLETDFQTSNTAMIMSQASLERFAYHFRYNRDAIALTERADFGDDVEWFTRIRQEIDSQRPVMLVAHKDETIVHSLIVDGYDLLAGSVNMYLLHCNLGIGGHHDDWYTLDNIAGIPGGAVGDELSAVQYQRAVVNILPSRAQRVVVAELFRPAATDPRNAVDLAASTALNNLLGDYGTTRVLPLAYHADAADPLRPTDAPTLALIAERSTRYSLAPPYAPARAVFDGRSDHLFTATGAAGTDKALLRAEIERRLQDLASFRVVGDAVLANADTPSPDGLPYVKADIYISGLDDNIEQWDNLRLRVLLLQNDVAESNGSYRWVVRHLLHEEDLSLGTGETRVVRAGPLHPQVLAAGVPLADFWVVALLEDRTSGVVHQAGLLNRHVYGSPDVQNTPPRGATEVVVTQVRNGNDVERLECTAQGAFDPDGDRLTHILRWYRSGSVVATVETPPGSFALTAADVQGIGGFQEGDIWYCDVRVRDSYYYSVTAQMDALLELKSTNPYLDSPLTDIRDAHETQATHSNMVIIIGDTPPGNSPPTAPTMVDIYTPTAGSRDGDAVSATEDLICLTAGSIDPDGDPFGYVFSWWRDSDADGPNPYEEQAGLTEARVPAVLTTAGENWKCRASARDVWGGESGWVESGAVSVQAEQLGAPSKPVYVNISPPTPSFISTLACGEPTGVVCPDAFTVHYRWWTRSTASWQATEITDPTVTSDRLLIGDVWRCEVYARNTVTSARGPSIFSSEVLIRNFPPSSPTPSVYPSIADDDEPLVCNVTGATDPDGDDTLVVYHFEWLVGGQPSGIAGLNQNTVPADATSAGEVWTCYVYAQDSMGARSRTVQSGQVSVGSRPTAPTGVLVAPVRPEEENDLICVAEGATDPDGDVLTYSYEWYRNGLHITQLTTPIVPSSSTEYGERWNCVVRASDGLLNSIPASSNIVVIGNQPPLAPVVGITPALPVTGQELTCAVIGDSSDPEGDVFDYYFRWYRNDALTNYTTPVLPAGVTQVDETWKCQVYAQDIRGARSSTVTTKEVTFFSLAPTAPTAVSIQPSAPKDDMDLSCSASGSYDPNGDEIEYVFAWYKNGLPVDAQHPDFEHVDGGSLSHLATADGDTWFCRVFARDAGGDTSATVTSNPIAVGNVPPTEPTNAIVTPNPAGIVADLTCSAGGSEDPNGDPVTYVFQWYQDEILVPGQTDYRLPKDLLALGSEWSCRVWASDGEAQSEYHDSNRVVIRNLPPSPPASAQIEPAQPTVVHDLVCNAGDATDPEGGPVTYTYLWFRNGARTDHEEQVVAAESTALGESWACQVQAVDADGAASPAATTPPVTIVSPNPSAPTAAVTPVDPSGRDELVCTVTGSEDPLGGTLTVMYHWFRRRAGEWTEPGVTGPVVASDSLQNGDVWSCTVYVASDTGYQSSTVTSNEVTVRNHAPTPPSEVRVTPEGINMNGLLSCLPSGSTDRDGDAVTYLFRWQTYDGNTSWIDSGDGTASIDSGPAGTQWRCLVAATDGLLSSAEVVSNAVVVSNTGGTAPDGLEAHLAPTDPAPADGEELTCIVTDATDVDGDLFAYRFQWFRWEVGAGDFVAQAGHVDAVLPQGVTQAGDRWVCKARALDATGLASAWVTSAEEANIAAARGAQPSKPVYVAVTPTEPSYTSTLRCSQPTGVVCDDAVTFEFRWERKIGDSWVPTALSAPPDELTVDVDDLGTRWRCRAQARNAVTDALGESIVSNEVLVRNFTPSTPAVSVSPQFASISQQLHCFASGSLDKEDGGDVTYHFEWLVNGQPTGLVGEGAYQHTLEPGFVSAGETWTCRVVAADQMGGTSDAAVSSNSIFVGTAPTAPTRVPVAPTRPEDNDDVTCTAFGATDLDGDQVTYIYEWYIEEDLAPGQPMPTQLGVLPENEEGRYWKQTSSGSVLPSAVTAFGDRWTCVIYAYDGVLRSAPVGSEPVRIGNQPPSRPEVDVSPLHPEPGDALECVILAQAVDPDGDSFTSTYRWYRDEETTEAYTGRVLPAGTTLVGEKWYCEVTVTDDWAPAASNVVQTATVYFVPAAPSRPTEVFIEPAFPKADQALVCVATGATDPNGDPVHYQYEWSLNGLVQGLYTADTVPVGTAKDDDRWACSVTAVDSGGLTSEAVTTATVTVGNRAPTAPGSVVVAPSPAGVSADLVCSAGGSVDPNGDEFQYEFRWLLDQAEVIPWSPGAYRVPKASLGTGQTWICEVRATDEPGSLSSVTASNAVTIQNLPPDAPTSVAVEPSAPTTIHDLVCVATGAADPEGGAVTYTYLWYRDSVRTSFTSQVVPAAFTAIGEAWVCEVHAVDEPGQVSPAQRSAEVVVGSPAPSDPAVIVTPLDPSRADALVCTASDSVDPLGTAISYVHHWFRKPVGSEWEEADVPAATVPAGGLNTGEIWRCAVYAVSAGGYRSSTVTSNEVTVVNHAPTPPTEVKLTPSGTVVDGVLTCSPSGAADRDGDGLLHVFRWQVYQGNVAWIDTLDVGASVVNDKPAGTKWRCLVSVTDGELSSAEVASNVAAVSGVAADPPTDPDLPVLAPGAPEEGQEILCIAGGSVDDDLFTYRFRWLKWDTDHHALQPGYTQPVLPPAVTADGERWVCEVAAEDATGLRSAWIPSAEVAIGAALGAPPSQAVYLAVTPADPSYVSDLLCSEPTGVTGADDVFFEYRWEQWVGDSWLPTADTGQTKLLGADPALVGSRWRCRVYAVNNATGAAGASATTAAAIVRNFAPSVPSVSVSPQFAGVAQDLQCFATGSQDREDGTDVLYRFEWLVNGQTSGVLGEDASQHTLPAAHTSSGETWTCRVAAVDQQGTPSAAVESQNAAFVGTAPTAPTRAPVDPTRPEEDDDVTCTAFGSQDADGDLVTYRYDWYEEVDLPLDAVQRPSQLSVLPPNVGWRYWELRHNGSILPQSLMSFGERWVCVIYATDGVLTSSPIASEPVWIGNQPPSKPVVAVNPDQPAAGDALECELVIESSDPEGDNVSYAFRWYRNSETTPFYSGQTLPAGFTQISESWYCEVTAADDWDPSAANVARTDVLVFRAVAPTSPTQVFVEPPFPKQGDTLTCVATGATDPNGDPIHYEYAWYLGGVLQPGQTSDTIAAGVENGQQWRCDVTAVDSGGLTSPAVASAEVTVANQPPSPPTNVTVTPNPAGVTTDLICSASGSIDPNSDPITYRFQWFLDGVLVPGATDYRLLSPLLTIGDVWTCEVTAWDGEVESNPASSPNVLVQNLRPSPPSSVRVERVELAGSAPQYPNTADPTVLHDLTCVATGGVDPEGGGVTYTYQWYRNDTAIAWTEQVVPAELTAIGESWRCEVEAVDWDGEASGPAGTTAVTILSPAPTNPSVVLTPVDPSRTEELVCTVSDAEDPLGGQLANTFRWFRKRAQAWEEMFDFVTESVSSSYLVDGDVWRCAVYVTTPQGFRSETVTSNEVTVVNHAPSPPAVVDVRPEGPVANSRLVCYPSGATDRDGDALTFVFRWQTYNENHQWVDAGLATQAIDNVAAVGTYWRCLVSVTDGELASQGEVASNVVQIADTAVGPPDPPASVALAPDPLAEGQEIVCVVEPPAAGEANIAAYLLRWYKDDGGRDFVVQPQYDEAVLPSGVTALGDTWQCGVRVRDVFGQESNETLSPPVAIGAALDHAPTIPVYVAVTPYEPAYTVTLTCAEPTGATCPTQPEAELTTSYRWERKVGETWLPTAITPTPHQKVLDVAQLGARWRCRVHAQNAGTGAVGPSLVSNEVLVRNYAPASPSASISPQLAKTGEDLQCFASGSVDKEDENDVVYHFEWFVNDQATGITGEDTRQHVLDAKYISPGETWTCNVYATDTLGTQSPTVASANSAFIGSPPSPPAHVPVSPARPEDYHNIICTAYGAEDPDGDQITYLYHWYRNSGTTGSDDVPVLPPGGWELAYTGAVLPSSVTVYADVWVCVVYAKDEALTSAAIASATLLIGNQPPSRPGAVILPDLPKPGEALECSITRESVDPEGDGFSYTFEWYRDEDLEPAYTGRILPVGTTRVNESWYCQVTVADDWTPVASNVVRTNLVLFEPQPPTKPAEVYIEPAAPKQSTELVCVASGAIDPNGDPVHYAFAWYKNGTLQAHLTTNTVPATDVFDGDLWYCEATAVDNGGLTSNAVDSAEVLIGNGPPTAPSSVVVTPDPAGIVVDLICAAGGAGDPNGDPITYLFQWYLDGVPKPGATTYRLDKSMLELGHVWRCEAWTSDGVAESDRVSSNEVVVQNLAPSVPASVAVSPASPAVIHDLRCEAAGAVDPEGGAVAYEYTWYRNGIATELTRQVVPAANTSIGEVWTCAVRAVDIDGVASASVRTAEVTIVSPAPSEPVVVVTPPDPSVLDALLCTADGSADPLDEEVTYVHHWFVRRGGQDWTEPGITDPTVGAGDLQMGDVWRCAVYAVSNAGFRSATVTSNEVSVVNHTPTAPALVLVRPEGGPLANGGVLTCSPSGATDRDGDAVTYAYRWQTYEGNVMWRDSGDTTPTVPVPGAVGTLWRCLVSATDGLLSSGEVASNVVRVADGVATAPDPPDFAYLTPEDPLPAEGEEIACVAGTNTPLDPDLFSLRFQWFHTPVGGGALAPTEYTDSVLPAGVTVAGEEWSCEVLVQSPEQLFSQPLPTARVVIQGARDNVPTTPVYVSITPAEPSYTSLLRCSNPTGVTCADAIEFAFRWERKLGDRWVPFEPAQRQEGSAELQLDVTYLGTRWRCRAYARNMLTDALSESLVSNEVLVENFAPLPPSVAVSPQFADITDELQCFASGSVDKEDGEDVLYHFEWLVDGKQTGILGQGAAQHTVPAGHIASGERWTCRVYAEDSLGNRSETVLSANSVFVGGTPTTPTRAPVLPARPEDNDDIICTAFGSEDPDGDPVTYTFQWYRESPFTGSPKLAVLPQDTGWVEAYSGALLPASFTSYGDVYVCVVHATDGMLTSAPIAGEPLVIGNQPPSRPDVQVSPEQPKPGDELECEITQQAADPEGDGFAYTFRWFRNEETTAAYTGRILPAGMTSVNDTWYCEVKVTDDWIPAASNVVRSDVIFFQPVAPTEPAEVFVEPQFPKTDHDLLCVARGSIDPNGDPIHYQFSWFKDGAASGHVTDTVPSLDTANGQAWYCEVVAVDNTGRQSASVQSAPIVVGNQAPTPPGTVVITPNPAGTTADLVCAPGGSVDPNEDQVTYEFRWLRNDQEFTPWQADNYRIASANLVRGDVWTCEVRATDGAPPSPSDVTLSNAVVIQNLPPTPPSSVAVEPAAPTLAHDLVCTATGSVDPEGGGVVYEYTWYRNGTITSLTDQVVPAANVALGEVWSCKVRAFDAELAASDPAASLEVTISSPAPLPPVLTVTPVDPAQTEDLTCHVDLSGDPLQGELTPVFHWFRKRGADWQEPGISEDTVSSAELTNGDLWRCAVYVVSSSGYRSSTVTSNEVTVLNHAPAPPTSVILKPLLADNLDAVTEGALSCHPSGATDRDGDDLTYTFRWQTYAGNVQWDDVEGVVGDRVDDPGVAGTRWRCLVAASDGIFASPEVASNVVIISEGAASAPTAPASVRVEPSAPAAGEELVCLAARATDADGDITAYEFAWLKEEAGGRDFELQAAYTEAVLPFGVTAEGETWRCEVRARDATELLGPAAADEVAIAAPAPLDAPSKPVHVAAAPAEPSYASELVCSHPTGSLVADDPEAVLVAAYRWEERVGETWMPTENVNATQPLGDPSFIGTVWRCRTHVINDASGARGESLLSNEVVVRNHVPTPPAVVVSPQFAAVDGNLTCFASGSVDKEEGSSILYVFEWLVGGVPSGVVGTGANQHQLDGKYTSSGETWTCRVYAVDQLGGESDRTDSSNSAFVGGPPSAPNRATVEPDRPEDNDDIVCTALGATDPDGDPVTYLYSWYRERDLFGARPTQLPVLPPNRPGTYWDLTHSGTLLPSSMTSYGERWTCVAHASDGELISAPTGTRAIWVGNQPPSEPGVEVSPEDAKPGDPLECKVTDESVDPEGDEFSYTFRWFRNEDAVPAYTGRILPLGMTQADESWVCEVTVSDDWSPSRSNTVESDRFYFSPVAPTEPTEVYLRPAFPKAGQELVCVAAGATDPNGDPIHYEFTWYRNGEVQVALTAGGVPAGTTVDGETWRCEAVAVDDEGLSSDAVSSAVITVADLPPGEPGDVTISPDPAGVNADLICAATGSVDPNGDAVQYLFQWLADDVEVPGQTSYRLDRSLLVRGQTWTCKAWANAGGKLSDATTSGPVTIVNLPPLPATTLSLSPAEPTDLDDLTCVASDAIDPEGGAVTYAYVWYWNGFATAFREQTLPAEATAAGEQWTCAVVSVDQEGLRSDPTMPEPVTVAVHTPSAPTVLVAPALASTNDVLVCTATDAVDPGGQAISYVFAWYRDDLDAGITTATLQPDQTVLGETWKCAVYARNALGGVSETVTSNEVTIANQPPGVPEVAIEPEAPRPGEQLTCQIARDALDPDGDDVAYTFVWHRNGQLVAEYAEAVVPGVATTDGDTWQCFVSATDSHGLEALAPAASAVVLVRNFAPTAPTAVTVTPDPASINRTLSCHASGSTDANGDGFVYYYQWYVDGNAFGAVTVEPGLDADLQLGEHWRCDVRAYDGSLFSPVTPSREVEVTGFAPELSGDFAVLLAPQDPGLNADLACQISAGQATDQDAGDPIVYVFTWFRDGMHAGVVNVKDPGITQDTLGFDETDEGEVWTCEVSAQDGTGAASGTAVSNAVKVRNHAPPPADPGHVTVYPPNPTVNNWLQCLVDPLPIDPDGDPVALSYQWFRDGQIAEGATGSFVPPTATTLNERWTCQVIARDPMGAASSPIHSEAVLIGGTGGDAYEWDNDQLTATPIEPGQPQSHSISPTGEVDWVFWELEETSEIRIVATDNAGAVEMQVALFDTLDAGAAYAPGPEQALLTGNEEISGIFPPGTYFLRLAEPDPARDITQYTLSFSAETARALGPGDEGRVVFRHTAADPVDWAYFVVPDGTPFQDVDVRLEAERTAGNGIIQVHLFGDTAQQAVPDQDAGSDVVVATLDQPGTYYVRSRGLNLAGTGALDVRLRLTADAGTVRPANSPPTQPASVQVYPGQPVDGVPLYCSAYGARDDDGDDVTFSYAWHQNDVTRPDLTGPRIDGGYVTEGDTWYCIVRARDDLGSMSDPVTSNTVTVGARSDWTVPLTVAAANSVSLEVGQAAGATRGWDEGVDDIVAPTGVEEGRVRAYFMGTDDLHDELSRDVRSLHGRRQYWYMKVSRKSGTTLAWDAAGLPARVSLVITEVDDRGRVKLQQDGDPVLEIDMRDQAQLDLDLAEAYAPLLRISLLSGDVTTEQIQLHRGWNLVSIRLKGIDDSVASVLESRNSGSVLTYDAASAAYSAAAVMEPKQGYWVLCEEDAVVTHVGYPEMAGDVALLAGWNIVAPVCVDTCPIPANTALVRNTVWTWNGQAQAYERAQEFRAHAAYWVYAREKTTINVK